MNKQKVGKSYSPYSGVEESCFILGTSGTVYPGVRIENIAFPLTISAIQGAVCSCLANGDKPEVLFQDKPYSELLSSWVGEFSLTVEPGVNKVENLYDPLVKTSDLKGTLKKLTETAVIPHSGFPVAAMLKIPGGYVSGVNVEMNAWILGLCAERVAIARAVTAGYTEFESMYIYAPKGDFCSPCGACRQVLSEWLPDKEVELYHGDESLSRHYTSQLLPYAFTTQSLIK